MDFITYIYYSSPTAICRYSLADVIAAEAKKRAIEQRDELFGFF